MVDDVNSGDQQDLDIEDNVNGLDPDEVARALNKMLQGKIAV